MALNSNGHFSTLMLSERAVTSHQSGREAALTFIAAPKAFMVRDQLRRDIEPAKAAGLVTIYVPSRFGPRWEPYELAVGPAYRVERFDQAVDIILAAD